MTTLLAFARGPLFLFCFAFMVLGLLRHVLLTTWEIRRVQRRAGDPSLPRKALFRATLRWLVPLDKLREQTLFTGTSILFHVGVLLVPLFLAGHIALSARGTGLKWPALPNTAADVLTIVSVIAGVALFTLRLSLRATRSLSRPLDFALPLLVALPIATGFFVMHPALDPFGFRAMLLVHVLSADLVMLLMPLTKLVHAVLLPGTQVLSEIGWHWPADSGSRVAAALGKEEEPV